MQTKGIVCNNHSTVSALALSFKGMGSDPKLFTQTGIIARLFCISGALAQQI
jgi:hypothetical protein